MLVIKNLMVINPLDLLIYWFHCTYLSTPIYDPPTYAPSFPACRSIHWQTVSRTPLPALCVYAVANVHSCSPGRTLSAWRRGLRWLRPSPRQSCPWRRPASWHRRRRCPSRRCPPPTTQVKSMYRCLPLFPHSQINTAFFPCWGNSGVTPHMKTVSTIHKNVNSLLMSVLYILVYLYMSEGNVNILFVPCKWNWFCSMAEMLLFFLE